MPLDPVIFSEPSGLIVKWPVFASVSSLVLIVLAPVTPLPLNINADLSSPEPAAPLLWSFAILPAALDFTLKDTASLSPAFRTLKSSPMAFTLMSVVDVRSILSLETISVRPPDSVLMMPA